MSVADWMNFLRCNQLLKGKDLKLGRRALSIPLAESMFWEAKKRIPGNSGSPYMNVLQWVEGLGMVAAHKRIDVHGLLSSLQVAEATVKTTTFKKMTGRKKKGKLQNANCEKPLKSTKGRPAMSDAERALNNKGSDSSQAQVREACKQKFMAFATEGGLLPMRSFLTWMRHANVMDQETEPHFVEAFNYARSVSGDLTGENCPPSLEFEQFELAIFVVSRNKLPHDLPMLFAFLSISKATKDEYGEPLDELRAMSFCSTAEFRRGCARTFLCYASKKEDNSEPRLLQRPFYLLLEQSKLMGAGLHRGHVGVFFSRYSPDVNTGVGFQDFMAVLRDVSKIRQEPIQAVFEKVFQLGVKKEKEKALRQELGDCNISRPGNKYLVNPRQSIAEPKPNKFRINR